MMNKDEYDCKLYKTHLEIFETITGLGLKETILFTVILPIESHNFKTIG